MGDARGLSQAVVYAVLVDVPWTGSQRAWALHAARFDQLLAGHVAPPVRSARVAAEVRRGRAALRIRVEVDVAAGDLGEAVALAWIIVADAAGDSGGWDLDAAAVTARPARA